MSLSKNKVKLSPRLQMGVGRRTGQNNIFKYGTGLFLVASAALLIRAGYMVVSHSGDDAKNPQVLGADTEQPAESQPLFTEYEVQADDTLFSISQEHSIDWTTLATLNNLKAPFTLAPGQIVKIPNK